MLDKKVKYWNDKLELGNIGLVVQGKDYVVDNKGNPTPDRNRGLCGYDVSHKEYYVVLCENVDDYTLIHEYGHIAYMLKTNYIKYVNEASHWYIYNNHTMNGIYNKIVDAFSNYNLVSIPEAYKHILKAHYRGRLIKEKQEQENFDINLIDYILYYLHWIYVLKSVDYLKYSDTIHDNLRDIQDILYRRAIIEDIEFSNGKLEALNTLLNKFNEIKDLTDYGELIKYVYEILITLDLWHEKLVKDFITSKFKIKIEKKII